MQYDRILKEVNAIFIDVLDDESIVLKDSSTAKDIEEWDSLNNIQLVVAIEKHFKVKFTTMEIQNWENVGQMCKGIASKLQS